MSHIFDGLQRSEGECSESDLATLSGATDLLRRAERRATSKWESTVLSEQPVAAKGADHTLFGLLDVSSVATAPETPAAAEPRSPRNAWIRSANSSPSRSRLLHKADSSALRTTGVQQRKPSVFWECACAISGGIGRSRKFWLRAQFLKRVRVWLLPIWRAPLP